MRVLVINPGTTSTKIAVFDEEKQVFDQKFEHSGSDLKAFPTIYDQEEYRLKMILAGLEEHHVELSSLNGVVGRGGLVKPIPGGTYSINERMLEDLKAGCQGHHASNLGAILSKKIADKTGIPSYIVDPIAVDELWDVARLTGFPEIRRTSLCHTLNHKAVARKVARELGKKYEECNFVICHLGTGTSVAAHLRGRMVDMCDARGEGPMSCERCGGINSYLIAQLAYSGKYTFAELTKKMYSQSGFFAYLGTKDAREVADMAKSGDEKAALVLDTMIYQNAKEIGAQAAALSGNVDRIIITGGIAYNTGIMATLTAMVKFIAPVVIVPGEEEQEALAMGALRVLKGEEKAKTYE
jgi:butyrate kinase